ncbi:MAG: aldehyde reductase [Pseudomonadota bacterium]
MNQATMNGPIFVTGATGYIAKYIVLKLLNRGYHVRGSARSLGRAQEIRDAVAPHLTDPSALDRLDIVALDLSKDDGWHAAMEGCAALLHTASPFPITQPKNPEETIRPAVDGTLRALNAAKAAGIKRVVLTSSTVAVSYGSEATTQRKATEEDWTDTEAPNLTPYAKSKTLAERAAWDFAETNGLDLTAINPSFVIGPPLDANYGTSIEVIERILAAKDPMVPQIGFATVDVEDIAEIHIRALETDATIGLRVIGACERFMWFQDMAHAIKVAFPERRIVTRLAPAMIVRLLALFDPAIRGVLPDLGRKREADGSRARELLGIEYRDTKESVVDAARFLIDRGLA